MNKYKLIPMVQFILEIDWLTTTEFCDQYKVPHPFFTGNVKTSADQFLQIDAIKHRIFVSHAKLLCQSITVEKLEKLGFQSVDVRGGHPRYKNGKYEVINDDFGFWLEPYDSVDGLRLSKVQDLVNLDLYYNGQ